MQVRDVLKGTLQPSELFDAGQIVMCEDHFDSPESASRSQSRAPIAADGFVNIQSPLPGSNGWGRGSDGLNGQLSVTANHREVELHSFKK